MTDTQILRMNSYLRQKLYYKNCNLYMNNMFIFQPDVQKHSYKIPKTNNQTTITIPLVNYDISIIQHDTNKSFYQYFESMVSSSDLSLSIQRNNNYSPFTFPLVNQKQYQCNYLTQQQNFTRISTQSLLRIVI